MGFYAIRHTCGHEKSYYLTGVNDRVACQIYHLERLKCNDCLNHHLTVPRVLTEFRLECKNDYESVLLFLKSRGYEVAETRGTLILNGRRYYSIFFYE